MKVRRGEIVLVSLPFASGQGGKIRPVLVIQSDHNNSRLMNTLVAGITSHTARVAHEATQYLIDVTTTDGSVSGLRFNSVVLCEYLATVQQDHILKRMGALTASAMQEIDGCLKAALGMA